MSERVCAYSECGNDFVAKTHNQRYCSDECCRLATNKRIMEKYYQRKERRKGARRVCVSTGCSTALNRYNDSEICAVCLAKKDTRTKVFIQDMVGYGRAG
jgi:hypothetical protein